MRWPGRSYCRASMSPHPTPSPNDDPLPLAARLGQGMRWLAWSLMAFSVVQAMQWSRWLDDGTGLRQLAAWPLLVLAWLLATALLHAAGSVLLERALRQRSPNAAAVLAADPRPPVLYLRPFDEDLRQDRQGRRLRFVPAPVMGLSLEQLISRLLGGLGPLVAIGRPGEALPPLGFARLYARDDEWQGSVLGLLDRAAAVVLVAGTSPGLLWELEQVLRRVPLSRVLIVIPAWPGHDHDSFRRLVAERLGLQVPTLNPALSGPFPQEIRALMSFSAAGQAQLHEWDWHSVPAPERGRLRRWLFSVFAGRGLPIYAALDLCVAQHADRAVAHLLRPAGIAAPDAAAVQQVVSAVERQRRLARGVALGIGGVLVLVVLVALAMS